MSLFSERRYGPLLAGLAYGWARKNQSDMLKKLPRVPQLGLEATAGIALAWGVSEGVIPSGAARRAADHLATALLSIVGMRIGEGGAVALQGDAALLEGDDELAGALEGDEDDLAALDEDDD